jgi:hypothetical protein
MGKICIGLTASDAPVAVKGRPVEPVNKVKILSVYQNTWGPEESFNTFCNSEF